jgi:hypothetical protein
MFSQSSRRPSNRNNNADGGRPGQNVAPANANAANAARRKTYAPKLYRPSVYSYTCHGYYFAASDQESAAGPGACRGITSRLEVIENQGLMTRAEALKRFSTMSADDDLAADGDEDEGGDMQQQAIYMSPVLIFQNKDLVGKGRTMNDNSSSFLAHQQHDRLPTEELIKRDTYECYGSTEVEYLMLEEEKAAGNGEERKETHFCAVAPRTTGVSFRQVDTEDAVRQITRIGLGWVQIIFDSNTEYDKDNNNVLDGNNHNNNKLLGDESPLAPFEDRSLAATLQDRLFDPVNRERLRYFVNFCEKVAHHTELNAMWLYGNLQDDFGRRTYQAGTRIVAELPKICSMTAANLGKIVRRMLGDDYDED